jgi:hypothetical protein
MGYRLSQTVKNAVVVGAITLLSSLVNKPLPDLPTLYQSIVAGLLGALLSYERQTQPSQDTQNTEEQQKLSNILKLLG